MKVENSGINPLSTKRPDASRRVDQKNSVKSTSTIAGSTDKIEMSENARLLAKARAEMSNLDEVDAAQLNAIKNQIASGDYSIRVGELARKLVARIFSQE